MNEEKSNKTWKHKAILGPTRCTRSMRLAGKSCTLFYRSKCMANQ